MLEAAQTQVAIAIGLRDLLQSTRGLITADAQGRQSAITSAASAVPGQLLDSLLQHLRHKASQQQEVMP